MICTPHENILVQEMPDLFVCLSINSYNRNRNPPYFPKKLKLSDSPPPKGVRMMTMIIAVMMSITMILFLLVIMTLMMIKQTPKRGIITDWSRIVN